MSSKKRHVGQNDSIHLSIVAKKKRQGDETSPEEASTKCSDVETDIWIKELELYLTERPPPPYEKYVKLLVEGGKAVLYSMLERVCRMKKLDMKDMSEFIEPSKMNEGKKCLNSNPSSWDVWQLSILLLEKFQKDLSANELKEIKEIYNAASKYAEALAVSLDIDRFNPLWTTLYGSIKCLTMVLDTDTKQKCDDLIRDCSKAEEANLTDLKRHYPDIKTVTDEYKVHINKLRELLSQMIEHGISFSEPQILECKIITLGETKEQKKIAEEKLYTVWQEALKSAEDSTGLRSVRKEVDKTLKRIISIPGVSEVTAKRNCIIVGIRCDTPMSILEVMAYLDHETYHQSIEVIENELFGVLDECIKIVSNCTLNSLHNIISFKDKGTNSQTNGISLPITCDSAEGIMEALKFWQSKELKESSEIISKSLSKNFEQEILLRTNFEGQFGLSETENKSSDIICGYYISNNDEQKSEDRSAKKHHSAERIEKQRNFHMAASSSENKQNDDVLIEERKEKRTGEYYDTTHQKVQISIGDCIRPFHNRSYATVGPFVRIKETGEICFLTVRHIFGRLDQPDRMFINSKVLHIINANSNKETEHECGRVVACVYNEDIDAAVVKLSQDYIPNRYSFAAVHDELLHKEGLYPLKYASVHSVMDVKNVRRNDMTEKSLLKVGCQTGWTKGTLLFNNEKINTLPFNFVMTIQINILFKLSHITITYTSKVLTVKILH